MTSNPVVWFEIPTQDIARARVLRDRAGRGAHTRRHQRVRTHHRGVDVPDGGNPARVRRRRGAGPG